MGWGGGYPSCKPYNPGEIFNRQDEWPDKDHKLPNLWWMILCPRWLICFQNQLRDGDCPRPERNGHLGSAGGKDGRIGSCRIGGITTAEEEMKWWMGFIIPPQAICSGPVIVLCVSDQCLCRPTLAFPLVRSENFINWHVNGLSCHCYIVLITPRLIHTFQADFHQHSWVCPITISRERFQFEGKTIFCVHVLLILNRKILDFWLAQCEFCESFCCATQAKWFSDFALSFFIVVIHAGPMYSSDVSVDFVVVCIHMHTTRTLCSFCTWELCTWDIVKEVEPVLLYRYKWGGLNINPPQEEKNLTV